MKRVRGRFKNDQAKKHAIDPLERRVMLAAQIYVINSALSQFNVTEVLTATTYGFTTSTSFGPQPGSNTWGGSSQQTEFAGDINATLNNNSITINPSNVIALNNGSWLPGSAPEDNESNQSPENVTVSQPANFGAEVNPHIQSEVYVAARNLAFRFKLPATSIQSNGSFSVSGLDGESVAGSVDYDGGDDGEIGLAGGDSLDTASAGTVSTANGISTLTIPFSYQSTYALEDQLNVTFSFSGTVVANTLPPTIQSLTATPNPATNGASTTLTATSVADSAVAISSVNFYRESNSVPGLQTGSGGDTLVGTATTGSGRTYSAIVSTSGLAGGSYTYYAQAVDSGGASSITGVYAASAIQVIAPVSNGTLSGIVFNDANSDGVQDNGESGLSGWTVFLDLKGDGTDDTGDPSTTTNSGGNFTFSNLAPGTYHVAEVLQSGYTQTAPAIITTNVTPGVAVTPASGTLVSEAPTSSGNSTPAAAKSQAYAVQDAGSASPEDLTPTDIRHAYAIDQVAFGSVTGDGSGQTIAIIDAYDDPDIGSDLQNFDAYFGLANPPSFTKIAQDGTQDLPPVDPDATATNSWELEESLDVEMAHEVAPGAKIVLVEASDPSNLDAAAAYASTIPGVSAISMSFGGPEYAEETEDDPLFTTPAGHSGITFIASSGDNGDMASNDPTPDTINEPASSPNVLAVGGTVLTVDSNSNYKSEVAWSSSGGGVSEYESQPSYQSGIVTQTTTNRATPDVAFDAGAAVDVYDSFDEGTATPWIGVVGTSVAAPAWAGIVAIADQGRALIGKSSLDGPSQTLPMIYRLPSTDFNDITSGSNGSGNSGYSAGPGYDLVTGRGTPIANRLILDLVDGGGTPISGETTVTLTVASNTSSSTAIGVHGNVTVTPDVQSFIVDNGTTQRSRVRTLTLTFTTPVTLDAGAITLAKTTGGTSTPVTFTAATSDGGTTYVITPTSGTSYGSLTDGNYSLVVVPSGVHSAANSSIVMTGANRTYQFFRLFGDSNGDGVVNLVDYRAFASSYLKSSGATGFNLAFDSNGDGTINLLDYRAFAANYLHTITS